MKQFKTYILLLLVCVVVISCKKDEIDIFSATNASAYFKKTAEQYSFVDNIEDEYCDFNVNVGFTGPIVDYDREVKFEIINEETTAPVDFYTVNKAEIPAGAKIGLISIRLKNGDILNNGDIKVSLRLLPNEYFSMSYVEGNDNNMYLSKTTYVEWGNQIKMPDYWLRSNFCRYVVYTPVYYDPNNTEELFSTAAEGRIRHSAKLNSPAIYSKKLAEILKEVWPAKINAFGYLGTDDATLELYPMANPGVPGSYAWMLIHQLEMYVYNYNKAHPDEPLRHSDDAVLWNASGLASIVKSGKSYKGYFKDNPLIQINFYGN